MKRFFSVTLILSLLLSSLVFGASVDSENISSNSGHTIEVPVYVSSDSGICSFGVVVKYDNSVFEPVSCNNNGFEGLFASNLQYSSNSIMATGADSKNSQAGKFKLFTAKFKVKDSAKTGNYSMNIIMDDASVLRNGEVVSDATGSKNITVSVKGSASSSTPDIDTKLDIDGDGKITKVDAEKLLNYVLKGNGTKIDLTYDGVVDSNDVACILKKVS